MNNCEYLTWLKRQRIKTWGRNSKTEKPRQRLINKLLKKRSVKKYDYLYVQKGAELAARIERALKTEENNEKQAFD